MFVQLGHPNANIQYFLNRKISCLMHIKMAGSVIVGFESEGVMAIYVFNVLGYADSVIFMDPNEKGVFASFKKYDKHLYFKTVIPTNNNIEVVYNRYRGTKKKEKNIINNIYANKFNGLSLFENVATDNSSLEERIVGDLDHWNEGGLDHSLLVYGNPFEILTDCAGNMVWIYVGYHKCENKVYTGFICLIFNKNNKIIGLYKHCNLCKKCSNKTLEKYDNISDYK